MPLTPGTRLGPYEVVALLGAGGMGEVYRAKDTRLSRTVAIKVLPAASSSIPEVRQRFEREARAVSALNHPNICTLYDIGDQDGTGFLVMEYLEGESLDRRLKKGALPLDQTLRIATEVCDALDRAHRTGITHRDLKPGNIMLTRQGAKVLDFGLAKVREQGPGGAAAAPGGSLMQTMTTPLTGQGSILGTLQYMAPEQLEGKEADARSDVFAFGAVLYEMVTGRRAFEASSQASLIAAILERDPAPINQVQPLAPPMLERLVRACLAKNPDERRQTAHDVLLDLKWIAQGGAETSAAPAPPVRQGFPKWIAAAVFAAALGAAAVWVFLRPHAAPARTMRFEVALPQKDYFGGSWYWYPSLALSPDGAHMAYMATSAGVTQLYMRDTADGTSRALPGTADGQSPFFSPDGQWLGAVVGGKLVKIPVAGGPSVTVGPVSNVHSASWGDDGNIYFDTVSAFGLMKVPAAGGTPQVVTKLDGNKQETDHRFAFPLPGGEALLMVVRHADQPNFDEADIEAISLKTAKRTPLIKGGTDPRYLPTGHLVFLRAGVVLAVPFDAGKLEVKGTPAPVIDNVVENPRVGAGEFAFSADGTLAYIPGGVSFGDHELVFVDHSGATKVLTAKKRPYEDFTLSPDGKLIATTIEGNVTDTWIHDIARDTDTRFTFGVEHRDPAWSIDGKKVAYSGHKDGKHVIQWKALDGSGQEEVLLQWDSPLWPWFWTRDGKHMLFQSLNPATGDDLWIMAMEGDRTPRPLLNSQFSEEWAQVSPDGKWVAYNSDESGRPEVYVAPFPAMGSKARVSTEGGVHPQWAPNGKELYYRIGSSVEMQRSLEQRVKLMAVPVETSPVFKAGTAHKLFEGPFFDSGHDYAVTPDGKGFIFIRESGPASSASTVKVVVNWFEELKRKMPAN